MGLPQQLVSMLKTHEKASDILGNVWVEIRISMHSETDVVRLKTEPREALAIAKTDRSVILPASPRLINGMVSKKAGVLGQPKSTKQSADSQRCI